jgi:ubiquinone biosynthesis protein
LFPGDLRSLRFATAVVRTINKGLNLSPLARELSEFVCLELDFARERNSTDRVRLALAQSSLTDVSVPQIFADCSTDRLLVTEFLEGTPLSRLDVSSLPAGEREALAGRIANLYAWMIFDLGFFHGDPHPGNLLVGPGSRLGLLDFGLARELPDGFAGGVAQMVTRGMTGDAKGAVEAAEAIGFKIGGKTPEDFVHLVKMLLGDYKNSKALLDVVAAAPVEEVPPHFALIVRAFVLLNGISETLAPGQRLIAQCMLRNLLPRIQKSPDREAAGAIG